MRGTHRVVVQNKRIRYDFELKRNLTILKGDSATGKTTLIEMIGEYYENGASSGVEIHADRECTVLSGKNWKSNLALMKDSLIFIDEGNAFVFTDEFAAVIQNTDNYYVIVTREGIPSLPYSVEEIYGIRNSGKYGTLMRTYNEFFHLYHTGEYGEAFKPEIVITEDSNSGYQFFRGVLDGTGTICASAGGKSSIFQEVIGFLGQEPDKRILVIADGAAFGSEMEKLNRLLQENESLALYLPESFEWLILKSGVVGDGELKEILASPGGYVDSRKYFSWERYFTALLVRKTEDTYLKYTKRTLNPAYLNEKIQNKIRSVMERVNL